MLSVPSQMSAVVERIIEDEGVTQEVAERYFNGMRQFLEVAAAADGPVSPSKPVDAAWHAFILHTWDYTQFCEETFGYYLHHQPSTDPSNAHDYVRAYRLASERFGELDELVWPNPLGDPVVGDCRLHAGNSDEMLRIAELVADCKCRSPCAGNGRVEPQLA